MTNLATLGRIRLGCRRCRTVVVLPVERSDACPDRCIGCGASLPSRSVAGLMKGLHALKTALDGPDGHFMVNVGIEE